MKNIFENAYFGKTYKAKDGRKAIYINAKYSPCNDRIYLILEGDKLVTEYRPNGEGVYVVCQDIVSEWKEKIDEEELDSLAEEYFLNTYNKGITDPNLDIINEKKYAVADFKAGYCKALKQNYDFNKN